MVVSITHESLKYVVYFAPRGKKRLLNLGHQLGQRHLSPLDRLIGVIGDAGAGKSLLIKGMFPGLELTNDDSGINIRPLPLLFHAEDGEFFAHSYHVDIRFELAFTPAYQLAEAIKSAVARDRRVVVEHFELIYPLLGMNAELLIGIGEEVIITRPSIFGPPPDALADIVFRSLKYRRMAHTAEDLTSLALGEMECQDVFTHNDVRHGFVLEFPEKPKFNIEQLEKQVCRYIKEGLDVSFCDEEHIMIGNKKIPCTGPRIHLKNTSEIEGFQLVKEFRLDPISNRYLLVGLIGKDQPGKLGLLNNFGFD